MQRATTEPRQESYDFQEWREKEKEKWCRYSGQKRPIEGQWIAGAWEMPYQSEADGVQQAAELADRFRRAYHASIRALRDWRRYPVIVQKAGQVNIAADGGQQVNLQKQGRSKKREKRVPANASRLKRKTGIKSTSNQLAPKSPEECRRIDAASASVQVTQSGKRSILPTS